MNDFSKVFKALTLGMSFFGAVAFHQESLAKGGEGAYEFPNKPDVPVMSFAEAGHALTDMYAATVDAFPVLDIPREAVQTILFFADDLRVFSTGGGTTGNEPLDTALNALDTIEAGVMAVGGPTGAAIISARDLLGGTVGSLTEDVARYALTGKMEDSAFSRYAQNVGNNLLELPINLAETTLMFLTDTTYAIKDTADNMARWGVDATLNMASLFTGAAQDATNITMEITNASATKVVNSAYWGLDLTSAYACGMKNALTHGATITMETIKASAASSANTDPTPKDYTPLMKAGCFKGCDR